MEELDLDVASEFILMASMLMSIKAKMMLPREEDDNDEIDETDPRYELVQKLLEYKRYKEMATKMADMDEETRKHYKRGYADADNVDQQATGEALKDVTLFDLISAFRKVLTDIERQRVVHKVGKIEATIEEQAEFVLNTLSNSGRQTFSSLCKDLTNRVVIVVTFLAILEMIKEQQINLFLEEDPTDFYIDLKPVDEIIGA
jgi:segregation and condensation protein A